MSEGSGRIILFDGVCNLCNSAVQFTIRHDKKNIFRFASLQSERGKDLLRAGGFDTQKSDSFVLIQEGLYFTKSTAALLVAKALGGKWRLLYALIIVPKFVRDIVYNFIAKNRYRIFGKREECMIPTAELHSKFLS